MSLISLFNSLYSRFVHYLYSGTNPIQINQVNTSTRRQRRIRTRTYYRRRNRYRRQRIDLENNFLRAQIIFRARQITARNREIARIAEQDLIDAILQARTEFEGRRISVQQLHTQNVRPARPQREVAAVDLVQTEGI